MNATVNLIVVCSLLCACENNLNDVQRVSYNPKSPDETVVNFRMVYNDSGYARVEVKSAWAETFRNPKHLTKLKDSLRVNFYSVQGDIISTLSARYGEIDHDRNFFTVRDSVRLYNHKKKQTLKTEVLYWNQQDSSIYTSGQVMVNSPKGYFSGKGFRSKQDFSRYEILKPQGTVELDQNETFN